VISLSELLSTNFEVSAQRFAQQKAYTKITV